MLSALQEKIDIKAAKIGVIGLGYVGLPVACLFADVGFNVVGVDILSDRVAKINAGKSPIEGDEPGLGELLDQVVVSGQLEATTDYLSLKDVDIIFINVETPVGEDNKPRYRSLKSALNSLADVIQPGVLVIVESTIAPGTMTGIVEPILTRKTSRHVNHDVFLGHCPERVMPGKLLFNLQNLDRVCGGNSPEVAQLMATLYRHVVTGNLDITDCITAEIVKTTENAYRDVQIAFANEVALLCESLGADVWQVRELVNKSPGRNMHLPGAGVGGHCIPKDGWLLIANAPTSFNAKMIPSARQVNNEMPKHIFRMTRDALSKREVSLSEAKVAVMGYAYLENSDDMRNTPSATIVNLLSDAGAQVIIHDPFVHDFQGDWRDSVSKSDAAIFMVAHDEYRRIEMDELLSLLRHPVIIDGRHIFDHNMRDKSEVIYRGIGIG